MKKKVFQLIGSLDYGGTQNVVLNILSKINHSKYEMYFGIFENANTPLEESVLELGGKIIRIPDISNKYVKYYSNLKNILKETGHYDIFHSHLHLNNGISLLAAKNVGIPVRISHSHSVERVNNEQPFVYSYYERIMKYLIRKNANIYLASSIDAGNYMYGKQEFNSKGIIFRNSIDIEEFQFSKFKRNQLRKEHNLKDCIVIGNVGTLSQVKNQLKIIEIVSNLLKNDVNALALIIGEGKYRENLERKVKELNIQDNIKLIGNGVNVADYLNIMDVFVFPSLHEGLGIAAIEAQANGLPVIISDGVPKEVIVNSNVVQKNNSESTVKWAETVYNLRNNRINLEENCPLVNAGYSNEHAGKIIENIYDEGLEKYN